MCCIFNYINWSKTYKLPDYLRSLSTHNLFTTKHSVYTVNLNIPYGQSSVKLPVIRSFWSFRSFRSFGSFGSFGSFWSFESFGSFESSGSFRSIGHPGHSGHSGHSGHLTHLGHSG